MKIRILTLLTLGLIIGCNKESEIKETQLFTLTVDHSFETSSTDNWIIVHNESGESLEFKSFESGEEIIIETKKAVIGNTVGITLITYKGASANPSYLVETYLNYPLGGKMTIENINSQNNPIGNSIGSFKLNLTHTSNIDSYALSNKLGEACSGPSLWNGSQFTCNFQCNIKDIASNYILVASDISGSLKYKKIDNVQSNAIHNIKFTDMLDFDSYYEFKFPSSTNVFLAVEGREADQSINSSSYRLQLHYQTDSHTSIKAGYLNSLSKYVTTFYAGPYYYYNKGGVPASNFEFPDKNKFVLNSKIVNQFSSSADVNFVSRKSIFLKKDQSLVTRVQWTINSSSTSHELKDLPSEILHNHPLLAFNDFTHSSTQFWLGTQQYPPVTPIDVNKDYVSYSISLF